MNDSQVAAQVGVSRQWVNTWRNHDEAFIQALQSGDEKTKLKTAFQVLHISGLQGYTQLLTEATEEDRVKKALLEALEEGKKKWESGGNES